MAKQRRTPPPPRPVQAPKRRGQGTTARFSRQSIAIAAALAFAAAVAIALAGTRGGGGSGHANNAEVARVMTKADCTFKTYPDLGRDHVSSLTAKVKYNSFPPTSGPHYFQPALWGFYESPLASQVQAVHNLEHGGIVVQWAGITSSQVERLRSFWQQSPDAMLMAPLPRLGQKFLPSGTSGSQMTPLPKSAGRIALAAWTHLAVCPRFDPRAFASFRDAYRGKGPEHFPVSGLTPGS